MTIEQYLRGKVNFTLSNETLSAILFDRNVTEGALVVTVSERQRDLCLADIYMFLATSSATSSSESDSDGGWSRQRTTKNTVNTGDLITLATALYTKWNIEIPTKNPKITFRPLD